MGKLPLNVHRNDRGPAIYFVLLVAVVTFATTWLAPTEHSMGHSQRIVYIHVAVAWFSLLSFLVMTFAGIQYLRRRELSWDLWSHAAGELGWLCCSLTLGSGALWAHEAWGTFWTWDPRLTTSFILWLIYTGILLVRKSLDDAHHRARVCAVLSLLGVADIPLVTMATRWFRGLHPVSPEMEPPMRMVLFITVACCTAYLGYLLTVRKAQLQLACSLELRARRAEVAAGNRFQPTPSPIQP